jgi:hypothetical protein
LVYRWIHDFRTDLPEPKASINVKKIEFNEIWHFVDLKKTSYGCLKQLITVHKKQLPGSLADAILQRLNGS